MTGDVVLLNSCLARGACADITFRDGVIYEIGDTEATGGTPKSDRENAAIDPLIDFRSSPSSRRSHDPCWTSGFDPGCVKTRTPRPSAQQLNSEGDLGKSLLRQRPTSESIFRFGR